MKNIEVSAGPLMMLVAVVEEFGLPDGNGSLIRLPVDEIRNAGEAALDARHVPVRRVANELLAACEFRFGKPAGLPGSSHGRPRTGSHRPGTSAAEIKELANRPGNLPYSEPLSQHKEHECRPMMMVFGKDVPRCIWSKEWKARVRALARGRGGAVVAAAARLILLLIHSVLDLFYF